MRAAYWIDGLTYGYQGTWARPSTKPNSTGCQCRNQGQPAKWLRDVIPCDNTGRGNAPPLQGVFALESTDGIGFKSSVLNQVNVGLPLA